MKDTFDIKNEDTWMSGLLFAEEMYRQGFYSWEGNDTYLSGCLLWFADGRGLHRLVNRGSQPERYKGAMDYVEYWNEVLNRREK